MRLFFLKEEIQNSRKIERKENMLEEMETVAETNNPK